MVVGFHAWWSWRKAWEADMDAEDVAREMAAAVNYAIARAFVGKYLPVLYTLYLSVKALSIP